MKTPELHSLIRAVSHQEVGEAIGRLVKIAQSDTHQSRRVADFLLAWWDGGQWGHFPILNLCNCDAVISQDMVIIMAHLSRGSTVYAYEWGYRKAMEDLIDQWRDYEPEKH